MEVATSPPSSLPVSPLLNRTNTPGGDRRDFMSKVPKLTTPISIPRRKSAHPPPRSPIRGQASSPDLLFNLDFSVSPPGGGTAEWEEELARVPLQQRGRMNMLLFQREIKDRRAGYGYAPFGVAASPTKDADTKVGGELTLEVQHRPYWREPFLCTIPKLMVRNMSTTHLRTMSSPNAVPRGKYDEDSDQDVENDDGHLKIAQPTLHVRNQSAFAALQAPIPRIRSNLSIKLQDQLIMPLQDDGADVIEEPRIPLTVAFQRPLESSLVTDSALSTTTSTSPSSVSVSVSVSTSASPGSSSSTTGFRPPTPVSPPRNPAPALLAQASAPRPKAQSRGRTSLPCVVPAQAHIARTPAAPIVSFKVAEADRGHGLSGQTSRERGRSLYPASHAIDGSVSGGRGNSSVSGSPGGRVRRRSTSAGSKSGTVLGTGRGLYAGRNVSAVLSTEDLERSLMDSKGQHEADTRTGTAAGPAHAVAGTASSSVKGERGRERERERERVAGKGWMKDIWARRGRARIPHADTSEASPDSRPGTPVERW